MDKVGCAVRRKKKTVGVRRCLPGSKAISFSAARYKNLPELRPGRFFGGEGGIRTHEALLTPTRFPVVRPRPAKRLLHTLLRNSIAARVRFRTERRLLYHAQSALSTKNFLPAALFGGVAQMQPAFFVKYPKNHKLLLIFLCNRSILTTTQWVYARKQS